MKREKDLMLFGASENEHVYKGLLLFLYVYFGASLFAAVTTPLAYWLTEWVNANYPCRLSEYLLTKRVDVFYDRLRWAPIVVALPFILKACGLLSWRNLGVSFDSRALKNFAKFWIFGFAAVAAIIAFQVYVAGASEKPDARIGSIIFGAVTGSIILGFLEEIVFRGFLMRGLYTAFGALSGMALSSLFFAYKHFKVPREIYNNLPDGGHTALWYSGFQSFYYDAVGISYSFKLIPFLSLFVFGMVLCMLYAKTKSLTSSIAFHAGAIFLMMIYSKAFSLKTQEYEFWIGNQWITNGCVGLCALLIAFALACGIKNSKNSLL